MKNKVRHCFLWQLILTVMGVVIWLSPFVSLAGVNPKITISGAEAGKGESIVDAVNAAIEDADIKVGSNRRNTFFIFFSEGETKEGLYTIEVNMAEYNDFKAEKQQKVMQAALKAIQDSDLSRPMKNKVYNDLCALDEPITSLVRQLNDDVRADFYGAYTWFKPFTGPIGILLGFVSMGIFTILALSIVTDMAYINISIVQDFLTERKGGKGKPILVSLEAWNAVKEAESKIGSGGYVNPNMIFLKHKTSQYIIISICLLYLVSGDLFGVIANWIDYFRGFLK